MCHILSCLVKRVTVHRFLVALPQGTPKVSEMAWRALLTVKARSKLRSGFDFILEEFCFKEDEEQECAGKRGEKDLACEFFIVLRLLWNERDTTPVS